MKSVQILNFLEQLDKILYKNSRFNNILNERRGKRLISKETNLKENKHNQALGRINNITKKYD